MLPFSTVIVHSVNPTLNSRQIDSKYYTQREGNLMVYVHHSVSQTQSWPTPHLTSVSSSTLAPACSSSSATWAWPSRQATWSAVDPSCEIKITTSSVTQGSKHNSWSARGTQDVPQRTDQGLITQIYIIGLAWLISTHGAGIMWAN